MMKRFYAIFLFCFLAGIRLQATPDTAQLLHFDLNNGFPSNNVYSVIQDRNGYLWFATDNGVVKYNGYSFKIFNTSTGLPSSDAYQLYEDKIGRIWVHSFSYQFGYIQNDKYTNISMQTHDRILRAYYPADNGQFLFFSYWENACYSLGIVKEKDLLTTIPIYDMRSKLNPLSPSRLYFSDVFIGQDCKLYAAASDAWLYVCDLLKPHVGYKRLCKIDYSRFPLSRLGSTYITSHGIIRFAEHKDDKLYLIRSENCSSKALSFKNFEQEYIYTVLDGDIYKDHRNEITVITNMAVYHIDSNQNVVSSERNDSILPVKAQIAFEFQDDNDNMWYTTPNRGAWCRLKKYTAFTTNGSLSELADSKYLGSSKDGGTFWWDKGSSVMYELEANGNKKRIEFPLNTTIRGFAEFDDSTLFLALSSGIYKYNRRLHSLSNVTGKAENAFVYAYSAPKSTRIDSANQRNYMSDHTGILFYSPHKYVSIAPVGLYIYTRYKDSTIIKVISDEHYEHLLLDTLHRKILGYNKSKIVVYDPVNDNTFTIGQSSLAALGLNRIINIEIDAYGNIFIADDNKIIVYNTLSMRSRPVTTKFNINNSSFHLSNGNLAIAGNFGLAVAHIYGPLEIGNFNLIPNVHGYYYNRVFDFAVSAFGNCFLNTDKGFFTMDARQGLQKEGALDINRPGFTKIVLNYPLQMSIQANDTIRINQGDEKINLDVVNLYGTGLPGFDYSINNRPDDIQQTDGEIFVGGLHADRYYKVTCTARDDIWKSAPLSFYLYRVPYWWQTQTWRIIFWLIGSGLVIVLLLGTILLTRLIVARANEKKRALTDLELRAIYAQINPHFIFNTLSAAQYFINKKRFDDAYQHVNKFSRLLRAYLKSSQDRYITLDEEVQMLKNYIELQQIRFEEKFEYTLEIENKIPANSIQIPSLLLQPLVENAINHGLFHKEKDGLLTLKFLQGTRSDELICIIEDNGIGRKQAGLIKKESSANRESYGTKLTQQLINIYREYEKMDIYLEYIDKTEPETGTIVKLTIKNVKYLA